MKQVNDDMKQENDPIEEGRVRLKDLLNAGIKNSDISSIDSAKHSSEQIEEQKKKQMSLKFKKMKSKKIKSMKQQLIKKVKQKKFLRFLKKS
jgi:sorbitol-specific phosphotransferase system component IIBC